MKWIAAELSDTAFTSSSDFNRNHAAKLCRLNSGLEGKGNWSAKTNDSSQWLQVDLGAVESVVAFAIQGRYNYDQWVTLLYIQWSSDLQNWTTIDNIKGAQDRNTVNTFQFPKAVEARYVRFIPKEWHNHISMRVDVAIVEKNKTILDIKDVNSPQKPANDILDSFKRLTLLNKEIELLKAIYSKLTEINKEMTWYQFAANDKLSSAILDDPLKDYMLAFADYIGLKSDLKKYKELLENLSKLDKALAKEKFSQMDIKLDEYDTEFRLWLRKAEAARKDKRKMSDSLRNFQKNVKKFTSIFEQYSYQDWIA
jgi:hypothetical protein